MQDKRKKPPFLISAENKIDPGELLTYLPELTQVEEIIIAWSYIQIIVYCYLWPPVLLLRILCKFYTEHSQDS